MRIAQRLFSPPVCRSAFRLRQTAAPQANEPAPVKIGFVTFLTGPAAAPFGIPDHNAAELLVDELNAGKGPGAL